MADRIFKEIRITALIIACGRIKGNGNGPKIFRKVSIDQKRRKKIRNERTVYCKFVENDEDKQKLYLAIDEKGEKRYPIGTQVLCALYRNKTKQFQRTE